VGGFDGGVKLSQKSKLPRSGSDRVMIGLVETKFDSEVKRNLRGEGFVDSEASVKQRDVNEQSEWQWSSLYDVYERGYGQRRK
jgi:hypothetical protein